MAFLGSPRVLVEALRAVRTGALMLAGGIERVLQPADEFPAPPLWLLRHTGAIAHVESSADATDALIAELELLAPESRVADAGCGFGIMATRLARRLGPEGRYVGFDIHGPSIRWAQRSLAAGDRRLRFVLVRSDPAGSWPVGDAGADLVLAKSLFTHLTEPLARGAFREIARCLAPGGRALVTAFLFEADRPPERLLPYPGPGAAVRWRWKNRPQAIVAYERSRFTQLLTEAGLAVSAFRPGFWPRAAALDAQDVLVLERGGIGKEPAGRQ